jgi:hypothetical protein
MRPPAWPSAQWHVHLLVGLRGGQIMEYRISWDGLDLVRQFG